MYLLVVCTVTCLIISFQEVHGTTTEEQLTNLQRSEKNFMALTFKKDSCYIFLSLLCVFTNESYNNVLFSIQNIDPKYNNLVNYKHDTIKHENAITALRLDRYEVDTREKTLNDVVDLCKEGGHLTEGYTRIINVVESAAFTIVSRFCELSMKLLDNDIDKLAEVSEIFFKWIVQVRVKFAKFNISYEPLRRVVKAFEVVIIDDDERSIRKDFYKDVYSEFLYRFLPMLNLVNVDDDRINFDTYLSNPAESLGKLKSTMKIAQVLFEIDENNDGEKNRCYCDTLL